MNSQPESESRTTEAQVQTVQTQVDRMQLQVNRIQVQVDKMQVQAIRTRENQKSREMPSGKQAKGAACTIL